MVRFLLLLSSWLLTTVHLANGQLKVADDDQLPQDEQHCQTTSLLSELQNKFNQQQQSIVEFNQTIDQQQEQLLQLRDHDAQTMSLLNELRTKFDQQQQIILKLNQTIYQQQGKLRLVDVQLQQLKRGLTSSKITRASTTPATTTTGKIASTSTSTSTTVSTASVGILRYSLTHIVPGNRPIEALTSFSNRLYVTREPSNSQIEVYDTTTFELIRVITVDRSESQWHGLAHCQTDDCLYVSTAPFLGTYEIHKVNLSRAPGENTLTKTSWPVYYYPRGLSVNRRGNLLVAYGSFGDGMIEEFTPRGSSVRRKYDGNNLWHAVEHTNRMLAVSRANPVHGVCLMSIDGQALLRCYGNTTRGSGPGMMNFPTSLAVDKEGFILVADTDNHRILVLNPTLSAARPLPLPLNAIEEIYSPRGLWFDESRGRLYVGEARNENRILVFDNVFNLRNVFTS